MMCWMWREKDSRRDLRRKGNQLRACVKTLRAYLSSEGSPWACVPEWRLSGIVTASVGKDI